MDETRKLSYQDPLLFPTRLKMVHIFSTGRKADVLGKEVTEETHVFFSAFRVI